MTKFLKSGNSTLHESLARPHARRRCPPSTGRGESRPVCRRPGWSQQASAWQTARCQDPWQIAGPDGHETRSCRQGPRQRRWCHSASQRYSQTPHVILSTSSLLPCWGRGRTRSGHGARGGDGQHDEGAPETSRRIHAQRPACRCGPTGVRNDQVGPTSVCDVRGQTPRKNATRSSSREQRPAPFTGKSLTSTPLVSTLERLWLYQWFAGATFSRERRSKGALCVRNSIVQAMRGGGEHR